MKVKRAYRMSDTRWLRGIQDLPIRGSAASKNVEKENDVPDEPVAESQEFDPFTGLDDDASCVEESSVRCTSCNVCISTEDREEFVAHYRSDWHRRNLIRVAHNKPPLSEEDFEDKIEMDEEGSESSDSDEDDGFIGQALARASLQYFVQDEHVFSVYKCLTSPDRPIGDTFFRKPNDCAIFLLAGGHFAAAIFKDGAIAHQKTIHRYVVRAKQGKAQGANDSKSGPAHSAGATLRRYNERMLREEIGQLIQSWLIPLSETPLLFVRCSSYQRQAFFGEGLIEKKDPRLRSLPVPAYRPTIDELKRVHDLLDSIFEHGRVEDFMEQMKVRREKAKEADERAQKEKKKKEKDALDILDDVEYERIQEEKRRQQEERQRRRAEQVVAEKAQEEAKDPWIELDRGWRTQMYAAVRGDDVESFTGLLESSGNLDLARRYVLEAIFPSEDNTFAHICVKNALTKILTHLLRMNGVSLALGRRNKANQVPYDLAGEKRIRSMLIEHRASVGDDAGTDWKSTHIPVPVAKREKDEAQLQREREREKEKKKARKERQKVKKEEEDRIAAEEKAKKEWAALSDREKRAQAAEARLSAMGSVNVQRCFQCGGAISGKAFEYNSNKLCSPSCVTAHRNGNPPKVI